MVLMQAIINQSSNLGRGEDDLILNDILLEDEEVKNGFRMSSGYCLLSNKRIIFFEKTGYQDSKVCVTSVSKEKVTTISYENAGKYDVFAVIRITFVSEKDKVLIFRKSESIPRIYKALYEWETSI